jgi:hypothetical protein
VEYGGSRGDIKVSASFYGRTPFLLATCWANFTISTYLKTQKLNLVYISSSANKKDENPLSINFRKFQKYNPAYFDKDEIILFEYLILMAKTFGNRFYKSTVQIFQDTNLKRAIVEKRLERFVSLGFLAIHVEGMPPVKHFEIDFIALYRLLPHLYKADYLDETQADMIIRFVEFCKPFADLSKQKNINKNINKHIKQEEASQKFDIDKIIAISQVSQEQKMPLPYFEQAPLNEAYEAWIEHCQASRIKKPETSKREEIRMLSKYEVGHSIGMIRMAIARSWRSIVFAKREELAGYIPSQGAKLNPENRW